MNSRKKIVAIIPARAGSEGIPNKNIISICNKPLLAWSVLHAKHTPEIDSVWVTSDGDDILHIAEQYGAYPIKRPESISSGTASSESAWIHAIQEIKKKIGDIDLVVGMQATSPIREPSDLSIAIHSFLENNYDSLFSASELEDYFIWEIDDGNPQPVNYNPKQRKMRQDIKKSYLENGSFYIFKTNTFLKEKNRLFGKIGQFEMKKEASFQLDDAVDLKIIRLLI